MPIGQKLVHQEEDLPVPLGVDGDDLAATTSHKQHTLKPLGEHLQEFHIWRWGTVKEVTVCKCPDTPSKSLCSPPPPGRGFCRKGYNSHLPQDFVVDLAY